MVDSSSRYLTGVIDWAEAEICPFGQNLYALEVFTGTLHLKNGWRRYDDYEVLRDTFWSTFQHEAGGISSATVKTIRIARIMGLLRSSGFMIQLAKSRPRLLLLVMMRKDVTTCYLWMAFLLIRLQDSMNSGKAFFEIFNMTALKFTQLYYDRCSTYLKGPSRGQINL